MFENRVLRKISGPHRVESKRRLQKTREIGGGGGGARNKYGTERKRTQGSNVETRRNDIVLKTYGADGKIILKYLLQNEVRRMSTGLIWFMRRKRVGSFEHDNGPTVCKMREIC
jgi:hypothetical protein